MIQTRDVRPVGRAASLAGSPCVGPDLTSPRPSPRESSRARSARTRRSAHRSSGPGLPSISACPDRAEGSDARDPPCPKSRPVRRATGWRPMTRCSRRRAAPGRITAPCTTGCSSSGPEELERRHRLADLSMRQQGITFTVYGREQGVERIIPFDPIPRLVDADEWATDRARPRAAGPGAQPLHRRRLPRPADPQGSRRPARAGLRRLGISPRSASACGSRGTSTSTSRAST